MQCENKHFSATFMEKDTNSDTKHSVPNYLQISRQTDKNSEKKPLLVKADETETYSRFQIEISSA